MTDDKDTISELDKSKKSMYDNIGCFFFILALAILIATCKYL